MWMLDTNTISYYFRGVPSVCSRLLQASPADLAVSTVVVYELKSGLLRLPDGQARRARLEALEAFLSSIASVAFDDAAADEAARIASLLAARGTPIGPHDVMIAATARARGATLVTHNVSEFARVPDLSVEDWFVEPA